jgi:transposase-like protein
VEDYPRDLLELEARFSTELACREYLAQLRWPEGFRCPRCAASKAWPVRGVLLECSVCGAQISVTAGTIFQDTRTPLPVWFRAMWWMTTQKNGASALGLQRVLGLKSYETAWTWLHKLRRAMVRPGRDLLSGRIEVDEGYIGGEEEGLPGRLNLEKTLVVVAAQEDGKGIGRIRMRQIPNASANCLMPFVRDSVVPESIVHTDGWLGYSPLESNGFRHEVTYLKGHKKTASELLPRVHLVISHLKRWLLGTHQGAVSHKHLDYYLDEFTFRFNRRRSKSRGKLFYRLAQQAVAVDPVPLDRILHPDDSVEKPQPDPSLKFLMLLFLILFGVSLSAQTLEITLVDGRNARPMVGSSSYVNVWVGTESKEAIAIPTDGKGVARLQLTRDASGVNIPNSQNSGSVVVDHPIVKYDESFRINAPYVLCGSGGSNYSWLRSENFSTKEILDHGYASPNTCGKITIQPHPGQVIIFVRPLTWWEKLKQ